MGTRLFMRIYTSAAQHRETLRVVFEPAASLYTLKKYSVAGRTDGQCLSAHATAEEANDVVPGTNLVSPIDKILLAGSQDELRYTASQRCAV